MSASDNASLVELLDRLVPMFETIRRRKKSSPWFDDECRLTKRQIRKLERRFRKTRSSNDRKHEPVLNGSCKRNTQEKQNNIGPARLHHKRTTLAICGHL